MTNKEKRYFADQVLNIYSGILFYNSDFEKGKLVSPRYNFDSPEFSELRNKYGLLNIAGIGTDFTRAKRICNYFAPKLLHSPWYDNHVECNSLKLLDYSFEKEDCGINCLNKAKILQELCLAVGIYARRVAIMPYSPYDFDNHVVTEIYDKDLKKWIMLDPSTNLYLVDSDAKPLSLLEARGLFGNSEPVSSISCGERFCGIEKLLKKYSEENAYIAKNLFYFYVDELNTFGEGEEYLLFAPVGFSIKRSNIANTRFRIRNMPIEYESYKKEAEQRLEALKDYKEPERCDISCFLQAPC